MSPRTERLITDDPLDRRMLRTVTAWDRVAEVLTNADLLAVLGLTGLSVTMVATLTVPDFGEMFALLQ